MDVRDWIAAVLRTPEDRLAELEQRIREQPEKMEEEGQRLAAIRYFLRCYRERQPKLLEELRALPLVSGTAPQFLWDLATRYYLPRTISVANEFMRTFRMWQTFPHVGNLWHFELPEGEWANPLRLAPAKPYPFDFKAEGWNPENENPKQAQTRLRREFQDSLRKHALFWEQAEIARAELRRFEKAARFRKLRQYLKCLAEKQADPRHSSNKQLARRLRLSKDAVRLGLFQAADLIELPKDEIRKAQPGRPSGGAKDRPQK
jgi:hypothetical protein